MLIAYWIVAGLTALVLGGSGAMKLVTPKAKLDPEKMAWAENFSATSIKLIGLAEVLGALGLVLPVLTGIAPILAPIAAIGLAIIMIGATVIHVQRKEPPITIAFVVLSLAAAVLGFLVVLG